MPKKLIVDGKACSSFPLSPRGEGRGEGACHEFAEIK